MSAQRPGGEVTTASGRSDAVRRGTRRALLASLGVALVIAAEAVVRAGGEADVRAGEALVLVGYSLLLWALVPAVVTLVVALAAALAADVGLRPWPAAALAGLATAAWVALSVGLPSSAPYGVVLGLGAAGAARVLTTRRTLTARVVGAAVVAVVTAVVTLGVARLLGP